MELVRVGNRFNVNYKGQRLFIRDQFQLVKFTDKRMALQASFTFRIFFQMLVEMYLPGKLPGASINYPFYGTNSSMCSMWINKFTYLFQNDQPAIFLMDVPDYDTLELCKPPYLIDIICFINIATPANSNTTYINFNVKAIRESPPVSDNE